LITAMGDVMRECYKRGWITTRDGNCSVRYAKRKTLYITPSGWRKTIIHPEHVIRLKLSSKNELVLKNGQNPSGELEMHYLLQRDIKKTRAVLHVHPTYINAAMYAGYDLQYLANEFPEVHRYTKVGPSVEKLPAISPELAVETAKCMKVDSDGICEWDIVGQSHHGCCAIGDDPWHAFEHIERLEHICQIVLLSGR
jgi:ribulose-5-phosphate 4-epimerase/fuculose-1-phosphate aldolase